MNGGNPVVTTVSSPRSIAGTSLSAVALTNWPTATRVFFTTYKKTTAGTKDFSTVTSWWGIVSGTTIGTLTHVAGAADAGNAVGDYIEMGPTAAWAEGIYDFGTAEHSTAGVHDATKVAMLAGTQTFTGNKTFTGTVTVPDSTIATAKIVDGAVTPAKLQSGTGTSWAWQSWTPTLTGFSLGNGTITAAYCQIGKTVFCRVRLVFGSTTSVSSDPVFTLPVTSSSSYAAAAYLGGGTMYDSSAPASILAAAQWASTTTVSVECLFAGGSYASISGVNSTIPFTWAVNDEVRFEITYQAA
jgi:hypothetical protein